MLQPLDEQTAVHPPRLVAKYHTSCWSTVFESIYHSFSFEKYQWRNVCSCRTHAAHNSSVGPTFSTCCCANLSCPFLGNHSWRFVNSTNPGLINIKYPCRIDVVFVDFSLQKIEKAVNSFSVESFFATLRCCLWLTKADLWVSSEETSEPCFTSCLFFSVEYMLQIISLSYLKRKGQ